MQHPRTSLACNASLFAALVFFLIGSVAMARGAEPAVTDAPAVPLDKLLTLPTSIKIETARRGGATRSEWRSRFASAEAAVADANEQLEASLAKLDELVGQGGNWKVAAPGSKASVDETSPLDFGLKQQINRAREEVIRTERARVDLKVEANLAGVPDEWWKDTSASSSVASDSPRSAR